MLSGTESYSPGLTLTLRQNMKRYPQSSGTRVGVPRGCVTPSRKAATSLGCLKNLSCQSYLILSMAEYRMAKTIPLSLSCCLSE